MVIKPLLMSALETALNKFLALDRNSSNFLAPLAGKIIAVNISTFNETIYLCPTNNSIQLLDYSPDQPHTQLSGSVFALGLMGLSSKPMRSIFSGEVKIEGDMNTGRKFQELFAKLDINLEQQLARFTGDTIAHNISQFFRAGQNWSKESIETFRLNASEFLQEETRDLPAGPEVDIFYRQIDELRTDFDRLQSRIERLENKGNS
ncbi:MAG: SCP2 sterol-binding domain-containing protein [Methylococcaceae bacterium]|jgi:ubiquinone biosynthesis protein UbiJ|nr:SCP2 sterol-binding domain-containing protein [Methylococcaceae bacterium]MDD1635122.1 SCP2 sterol-binding domain-containing protein [Methylococcaceae bacterium]MDD1640265.1 SCP2 sterol-binding domain-containing protein [Methylococcaceae bacterium]